MLLPNWCLQLPLLLQIGGAIPTRQKLLKPLDQLQRVETIEEDPLAARPLKGRFLHISGKTPRQSLRELTVIMYRPPSRSVLPVPFFIYKRRRLP